jgi:ABC-type uncharacterized transport system substrate-binding protein
MAGQFQDFLIDSETGDLLIRDGDFVVGPSDNQHINDIISCFAGSFKQFPSVGVGIMTFLKSQNGQDAVNQIKQQLQADGYQVPSVKVTNTNGLSVSFPQGISRNV